MSTFMPFSEPRFIRMYPSGSRRIHNMKPPQTPGRLLTVQPAHSAVYDPTWKMQPQRTRPLGAVLRYTNQFFKETSLHGLQYVGNDKLHWTERCFWFLMFVCALATCSILIKRVWDKWNESPVIVAFEASTRPVWDIPFPAITLCNLNKVKLEFYNSYINDTSHLYGDMLRSMCPHAPEYADTPNFTVEHYYDFLLSASYSCEELLLRCKWRDMRYVCSEIFQRVVTDQGVCCSFNVFPPNILFKQGEFRWPKSSATRTDSWWDPEVGYAKSIDKDRTEYPRRTSGTGRKKGLSLVLNVGREYLSPCNENKEVGFKITLHSPVESPRISQIGSAIAPGTHTYIVAKPRMIMASQDLRRINPNSRKCFFSNEQQLRYFYYYTQKNCFMECASQLTLQQCQCIDSFHPKPPNTTICGPHQSHCTTNIDTDFLESVGDGLDDKEKAEWKNRKLDYGSCDCLTACSEVSYDMEISAANVANTTFEFGNSTYLRTDIAMVHIFYRDLLILSSRRNELFGLTDFLGTVGGLLGLFLGFSILSFIELIYFPLYRVFMDRYKKRKLEDQRKKKVQFPYVS